MERTYAPLIREFSSIKGYQAAYTLVYALDASEGGCHLTLDRKGEREQQVSEFVPLAAVPPGRTQHHRAAASAPPRTVSAHPQALRKLTADSKAVLGRLLDKAVEEYLAM